MFGTVAYGIKEGPEPFGVVTLWTDRNSRSEKYAEATQPDAQKKPVRVDMIPVLTINSKYF